MDSPRSEAVRAECFQEVLLSRVQALQRDQMYNLHQVRRYTDQDTFNKIIQREIDQLEFSCGSLHNFVELACANMHAVRHAQPGSGSERGAEASALNSRLQEVPPPAVRRTKRKSYILAESLAASANEHAQSAYNSHQQAASLQEMD